ncbi:AbiH family protein [Chryseobacterium sp. NKUCC03_KSP]|uniref:AbiH family protein n=1 Tax=Chryseobacterium sp. NKUCC03_KSP TaxID=2842125 RepID=UPI001C5B6762|nr:AbiH family protein [Chryseobacterium sp. NKUCC03_KSP]MBW3524526.1 bacteriophage abortive infection AbiH family protein [Chryseobacterium sp. NKUCC03_KSP]
MNKIILIGNGFDLAHGLKTSYSDFIDDFESNVIKQHFHRTLNSNINNDVIINTEDSENRYFQPSQCSFKGDLNAFKFNNVFFAYVLNRFKALNYYDLESFFYEVLKEANTNNIEKLNSDFYSFINQTCLNFLEKEFPEN